MRLPDVVRLLSAFAVVSAIPAPRAAAAQRPVAPAPARRLAVRADDGHELVVWSKRPTGPPHGSILLLHGRTWSSLPNFDLRVPGQHVSLMDAFVSRGYTVYALRVPVLLINGERDPYAARADLPVFLATASGVDRSWVVLSGSDHVAHLERQDEFADAVTGFLARVARPSPTH